MSLLNKRIPTLLVIVLVLLAGGLFYWKYGQQNNLEESLIPQEVRISNVSDSKFSVSWLTTSKTVGKIEWGEVGGKLEKTAFDDRDSAEKSSQRFTHHITVSELQPNTRYAFRIISGENNVKFDNDGGPYSVTTGPIILTPPGADSFYGKVESEGKRTPEEAIVYLTIPGAGPLSTLVKSSGNYSFSLSTARTEDLNKFVTYDPAATVAGVLIVDGVKRASASVSLTNSEPVPLIVMGSEYDYRTNSLPIAQVEPGSELSMSETGEELVGEEPATAPQILNVEPLTDQTEVVGQVVVLNPLDEGEEILTLKPEFFGEGPPDTVISITVHSATPFSDILVIDENGEWSWQPPENLTEGEHTLTIAYIDEAGEEQVITRSFLVKSASAAEPAFEATPSGTTASPSPKPSPTPSASVKPSPSALLSSVSASPREIIPSTESGVPVSGVIMPTLLTLLSGFAIMVIGALLLVL